MRGILGGFDDPVLHEPGHVVLWYIAEVRNVFGETKKYGSCVLTCEKGDHVTSRGTPLILSDLFPVRLSRRILSPIYTHLPPL